MRLFFKLSVSRGGLVKRDNGVCGNNVYENIADTRQDMYFKIRTTVSKQQHEHMSQQRRVGRTSMSLSVLSMVSLSCSMPSVSMAGGRSLRLYAWGIACHTVGYVTLHTVSEIVNVTYANRSEMTVITNYTTHCLGSYLVEVSGQGNDFRSVCRALIRFLEHF